MAIEFDEFVKRFAGLKDFLNSISSALLLRYDKEIVGFNNEQLLRGVNVEGRTMQKGYSPQYGKRRKKAGLQTAFVDLKFTGKYQDTKKGVAAAKGINLISDTEYEKYLRGNFPDHVGLTKKNAETTAKLLEKEVAVEIEKYLTK